MSVKLFNVNFDYTESASIPYIAADNEEAAIAAAKILTARSKMNSPTNYTATEVKDPQETDDTETETRTIQ